jgi:hypothetical protein
MRVGAIWANSPSKSTTLSTTYIELYQGSEPLFNDLPHFIPYSCLPVLIPFLRLVRQDEAQSYGCSAETLGGTGREGVHNLLRDGNFGWNKWFDPTVYAGTHNAGTQYAYAQVNLARPVRLVGYGVKSANDVPARDPKDWHLEIANNFIPVHSVANEHFPNRYETHWFSFNEEGMPQPTRMIRIVVTDTLRRRMEGARIPGTQIGQLYFLVVDEE